MNMGYQGGNNLIHRNLTVSICMATYNGEKYIANQLESILEQLCETDEVIVSDDGSSDATKEIVNYYAMKHKNIVLVDGPRDGFSCNFGNAICFAKNDIVFLSDQDDIWRSDKVSAVCDVFDRRKDITTVLHNMATFRKNVLKDTNELTIKYHSGTLRNFIKSCYWGCCMAIRKDFIKRFIPFRAHCEEHDQLIGLMSEKYGKTAFVDEKLIWHRLHESNTSGPKTIHQMVNFRIGIYKDFVFAKKLFLLHNE